HDIKFEGGLKMLIVQAIKAFEIWNEIKVDDLHINKIYNLVAFKMNPKVALMGMPLAGKSTLIKSYHGSDLDATIEKKTKQKIALMLEEGTFRDYETAVLKELVDQESTLIALGGGAILKHENIEILKDYLLVYIDVSLPELKRRLKCSKRPLLKSASDVEMTYNTRLPIYLKYANVAIKPQEMRFYLDENSYY
ncbi:MAG: shikimate kinase, partial [Bacilli bacterium]